MHLRIEYLYLQRTNNSHKVSLKRISAMKKIFSFAIMMAAVAMFSCAGNANKPAEAEAAEAPAVEACCAECAEEAEKDECCKDECCGKEKCDKPAEEQCDACKAKAAEAEKAE